MNNLAEAYRGRRSSKRRLAAFRRDSEAVRKAKLGPDHPDTLSSMNNLALAYKAAGRLSDALPLHEETLKLRKAKLGSGPSRHVDQHEQPGRAYQAAGRLSEALPLYEETLKRARPSSGRTILHADQHGQPGRSVPGRRPSEGGLAAFTRRRLSCARPSSVRTIPTR